MPGFFFVSAFPFFLLPLSPPPPFLPLPRPWAPRGTCRLRWSRLRGARCRACKARSRETVSVSWPSFLAWSVMSGPRFTPTTGSLHRTRHMARLLPSFLPERGLPRQHPPIPSQSFSDFHSLNIAGGRIHYCPVKHVYPAPSCISLLLFNLPRDIVSFPGTRSANWNMEKQGCAKC